MNNKETTASLTIVGIALLATITMISPTQALALDHWNLDKDIPPRDFAQDGEDSSGTSYIVDEDVEDNTNKEINEERDEGSYDIDSSAGEKEDPSQASYHDLQACLSDIESESPPTEQEVQDCINSSYSGTDSSKNAPTKSTDYNDKESSVTEHVSADDTEDEEEEEEDMEEEDFE